MAMPRGLFCIEAKVMGLLVPEVLEVLVEPVPVVPVLEAALGSVWSWLNSWSWWCPCLKSQSCRGPTTGSLPQWTRQCSHPPNAPTTIQSDAHNGLLCAPQGTEGNAACPTTLGDPGYGLVSRTAISKVSRVALSGGRTTPFLTRGLRRQRRS